MRPAPKETEEEEKMVGAHAEADEDSRPTTSSSLLYRTIEEIRLKIDTHDVDRSSRRMLDAVVRGATAGVVRRVC